MISNRRNLLLMKRFPAVFLSAGFRNPSMEPLRRKMDRKSGKSQRISVTFLGGFWLNLKTKNAIIN